MTILRKLTTAAAAAVLALGGAVATGTPAQGAPPGCSWGYGHYEQAGNFIAVYNWWFCDDGNDIPLRATISRYLSPGVYQTVASGEGDVFYNCAGTLYNVYRAGGDEFGILCS